MKKILTLRIVTPIIAAICLLPYASVKAELTRRLGILDLTANGGKIKFENSTQLLNNPARRVLLNL